MRRTLIIGSIVVVVLGLGVALYFLFAGNKPSVGIAPNPNVSLPTAGDSNLPPPTTGGQQEGPTSGTAVTARLIEVDKGPVVPGFVAYQMLAGRSDTASGTPETAVNFIERQSGNIFTYFVTSGTVTRISNRTVPGIQKAVWLPSASTTYVRYLSNDERQTINTFALPSSGDGGFFLPQNISDLAVSSTSVLTLASGVNGSVGTLLKPDGTNATSVFSSPLTSLRIGFAGKSYAAFTKPAAALDGYAFMVDGKTGAFTRVAGPLKGLAALPSPTTGKWLLISYVNAGSMKTALVNTTTSELIALPISTIVDKCVWATAEDAVYCGVPISPPQGTYPDDWYQGATSFSDRIWKIDVTGRFASLALDFPKESSGTLDATALAIDPNEQLLVFQNKIDGALWAFKL